MKNTLLATALLIASIGSAHAQSYFAHQVPPNTIAPFPNGQTILCPGTAVLASAGDVFEEAIKAQVMPHGRLEAMYGPGARPLTFKDLGCTEIPPGTRLTVLPGSPPPFYTKFSAELPKLGHVEGYTHIYNVDTR